MYDQLQDSRSIHLFNAIDGCNREALGAVISFSLTSWQVVRCLNKHFLAWQAHCYAGRRGLEVIVGKIMEWAAKH